MQRRLAAAQYRYLRNIGYFTMQVKVKAEKGENFLRFVIVRA